MACFKLQAFMADLVFVGHTHSLKRFSNGAAHNFKCIRIFRQ